MKIKPPRQAQEWSYSSHRESIGKSLSSPGIRSNKKTHINCGSSARMAGDHDVQEDFYTRLGAHDGAPPAIPFGNIQSSLIQPICHPKGKSTS
ncbi:hypothetical protein [Absidia glauca]|uniref:Ndc10 domain-containing protein n=1 Tax=Absidia glauca TaxID=4829 RepID=A0A168RIS5_ABSGL|nr:hypothetical protein [Absidia glauca]